MEVNYKSPQFINLAKGSFYFFSGALVLGGLYLTSLFSYLLFHTLVESFTIFIAIGIFVLAWNTREIVHNNFLIFLGISALFIASLDLVHTLAYKGMGIFTNYNSNLPTQLWITARFLQSISILLALLLMQRKIKPGFIITVYTFVVTILFVSIFERVFPTCFIEGSGLTPFKRISEYIITLIFGLSILFLFLRRSNFANDVWRWLILSTLLMMTGELAFTFYTDVYGLLNMIGHLFKLLAFYFLYKTFLETGLTRPYELLFRDLKQAEQEIVRSNEQLRNLNIYWQDALETERTHVSHEIHDKFSQSMSALKMDLTWLKDRMPDGDEKQERLQEMNRMVDESVDSMRRLTSDLRSGVLDELGLNVALKGLAQEFTQKSNIPCQLDLPENDPDIDLDLSTTLFRIFQKALLNIFHYAQATKVKASLKLEFQSIVLIVQDNGRGISQEEINDPHSLGLLGLRERAAQWGGDLSIQGEPGKGTTITVHIPLLGTDEAGGKL